jgi:hypothetical protein
VPPPGTATASAQPPGEEYYDRAKTSANTTIPEGDKYTPRGGFNSNVAARPGTVPARATITGGTSSGLTTPASNTPPAATPKAGGTPAKAANPGERPPATTSASRSAPAAGFQVNSNPTRGLPATTASTRGTTSGTRPQPVRDLDSLPDPKPSKTAPSRDSGGFRPPGSVTRANFEEDVKESSSSSRTPRRETIGSPGQYSQDANYRWLKGKLDYSRIEDRWKLRYIPIDGDTDDYGGSVILLGSRMLEGYKPGEYVTVYGTLGETDARGTGYAPTYKLDRVQRQSEE